MITRLSESNRYLIPGVVNLYREVLPRLGSIYTRSDINSVLKKKTDSYFQRIARAENAARRPVLVAEESGEVQGVLETVRQGNVMWLEWILSMQKGWGIGTSLLSELISETDCDTIQAVVHPANVRAARFFEGFGFCGIAEEEGARTYEMRSRPAVIA